MRWLIVFVLLAIGCSEPATADEAEPPPAAPTAAPPPPPPSAQDCLVDGRSLEFQVAVARALRDQIRGLPPLVVSASTARFRDGQYVTEMVFELSGSGDEIQVYAVGGVDAATCAADLQRWELF
ncbi:MAG: hypothetical protein F4X98_18130 [Gammaproteobacteria bacterium]|nr:hypothetical protein [Gammaproteobacteria bacterium]